MLQIFTCGLSDLLLLAVRSLVVFVLGEYINFLKFTYTSVLNINDARSEILVWCLVVVYCFFKQIVDIYFLQSLLSRVKLI